MTFVALNMKLVLQFVFLQRNVSRLMSTDY